MQQQTKTHTSHAIMHTANRITKVEVDWMTQYANRPRWRVYMPEYNPDLLQWIDKKVQSKGGEGTAYYAQHNALVSFMFHSPRNENGYGGHVFELPMYEGGVRKVKGPWSSNSASMNQIFPPSGMHCTEATLITQRGGLIAGAVRTKDLIQACIAQGQRFAYVEVFPNSFYLEPCDEEGNIKPSSLPERKVHPTPADLLEP